MANPYLIIETLGYKKQTKVHDKKLNLTFDEVKVFPPVALSYDEYNRVDIIFTMMHSNGMIRTPMVIGKCNVDLSAVHGRNTHEVRGRYLLLNRFFPLCRDLEPGAIYGYLKLDILVFQV
jgi:hypothetical protein